METVTLKKDNLVDSLKDAVNDIKAAKKSTLNHEWWLNTAINELEESIRHIEAMFELQTK